MAILRCPSVVVRQSCLSFTTVERYRFNPLVTNGVSHLYHLDEPIFILGASGVIFILFRFLRNFLVSKQISSDGAPRFAASHLGLFCLSMSHKKDPRLIWVKVTTNEQNQVSAERFNFHLIQIFIDETPGISRGCDALYLVLHHRVEQGFICSP